MKRLVNMALATVLVFSLAACNNIPSENQTSSDVSTTQEIKVNSQMFFVGGSYNGAQYVGQSMIHQLSTSDNGTPIIMLPGLGLPAYIYSSTPDGRSGWTSDFANAGFDTYSIDTNNLAVSGLDISKFSSDNPPKLSVWGESKIWKTWGFGETPNNPYDDTQYPTDYINQLYASLSPQVTYSLNSDERQLKETTVAGDKKAAPVTGEKAGGKGGSQSADKVEVANIIELLEKTGPAILMVHSMGGVTGVEVVNQRPDLIKALVVIEPVGSPTDENLLKEKYLDIPYLAVYGDYIESRGQTERYEACKTTAEILENNGGTGEVISLTELGIKGNTHLMMQDKNSSDIAKLIIDWLNTNVK